MDDLLGDDGEYDMGGEAYEEEEVSLEEQLISMEDAWVVIDNYFSEKGLVGQQIDSFDEFLQNTIQEVVDDWGEIIVTPEDQFIPGQNLAMVSGMRSNLFMLMILYRIFKGKDQTRNDMCLHNMLWVKYEDLNDLFIFRFFLFCNYERALLC